MSSGHLLSATAKFCPECAHPTSATATQPAPSRFADRDPEEARKLLDPVLELMMDAVHRYEATVNQLMGDGIMALFGAPLAHEDHAVPAGPLLSREGDRPDAGQPAVRTVRE